MDEETQPTNSPSKLLRFIRVFLFILIILGLALIVTQKIWVPKLVDKILDLEGTPPIPEIETKSENSLIPEWEFNTREVETINSNQNINKEYPTEVTYRGIENRVWAYETMYIDMEGEELSITQEGQVIRSDGSLFFNLGNEFLIERLFFYPTGGDVIAISQETDQENGWAVVRRISKNTNKLMWSADIPGFNLSTPVIVNNDLYISAIGFVGKLNLETGQYVWKFEDLYENHSGKYNSFNEPTFNEDKVIFSTEIYKPDGKVFNIVIDDKTGQMISKD